MNQGLKSSDKIMIAFQSTPCTLIHPVGFKNLSCF